MIQRAILELMQSLAVTDIRQLQQLIGSKADYQLIGGMLQGFIENRLERPLKSRVFLDNLLSL